MPDGTSFFSAPRTNNRFDVGERNICKQLTSRRHAAFPPKYARALSVTGRSPWASSGSPNCPHIIINWTFVIAGTERPTVLPYSRHHGSAKENPGRAQKGGDCRTRAPWLRRSRQDTGANQTNAQAPSYEAKITSDPNLKARPVKSGDNSHLVARF